MTKQTEKLWNLSLNRRQLEHIRDLMGIVLPHDYTRRLSLELAITEKRLDDEAQLWTKLCETCESADIAVGVDAPDFTITTASVPRLDVSRVTLKQSHSHNESEEVEEENDDDTDD